MKAVALAAAVVVAAVLAAAVAGPATGTPVQAGHAGVSSSGVHEFTPGYALSWIVDGDRIHFNATNTVSAWTAFGFNPAGRMDGADVYAVTTGGIVADYTIVGGYTEPTRDVVAASGCTDDVIGPHGEFGGVTVISFTRLLDTGDSACDFAIAAGPQTVVWAHGRNGVTDLDYHQQNRGVASIEFFPAQAP